MKRQPRHHGENTRYLREIIERLRDLDFAELSLLCERHRRDQTSSPLRLSPRRGKCRCAVSPKLKRDGRQRKT